MHGRPYFLWDVNITDAELRERLKSSDPLIRAQWEGRIMREARFADVWTYMTLSDVLRDWELIQKHLGRMRGYWQFLLNGWRADGLLEP